MSGSRCVTEAFNMDVMMNILGSLVTVGFVFLVIIAVAVLFMIVFSIATSLDKRVTQ